MGVQNGITNVLLKTFFVTLLQVSLLVQHESISDQHSVYWPFNSLTFLMWCCTMVFTVPQYNGIYCTPANPLLVMMIMMMVMECHVQCRHLFSQQLMEV